MGIDRFNNFILKYIDNNIIDDVDLKNVINIVASECIIIDTNFLIYQEITEIENEVNDIIKIILSLPSSDDNYISIEKYLKIILSQKHWEIYNFNDLLDGFNENEIVIKFIKILTEKKNISSNEVLSLIELIIYEKILNKIIYIIDNVHYNNFIQTIALFFDGIPSLSKILEQRKRRIKNYLESGEKKRLYKLYFDNLEINNEKLINNLSKKYIDNDNNNLYFDYIKWIKNRFTTNKSISPSSTFLINLEKYLKINLSNKYTKYKIYINSSKENGESDLKIFNYISNNNNSYDYSIHTSDSDLIHQIMIQQAYYKIINKNINLSLIRYIKKINNDYIQIIDANKLINNILESYNKVNNIKTNNYKIIWDLCYLFYFFGNDHLPSSIEIGPELGLDFFLKTHYKALNNNNIINLKKTYININLENLKLLLITINETNEINKTRIILYRYFKINSYLITIFIDKFKLCFNEIIIFLKKFIINRAVNLSEQELDDLDDLDMRKIYIKDVDIEMYKDYSIFNLSEINLNILKENINLIQENIDYYEQKYNGLILYNKPIYISNDSYQDLYNYINDKAVNNISELYPLYYDYNNIEQYFNDTTYNIEDYLKKVYHLVYTQFGSMKQYYNNITIYKYYNVPNLLSIIDYLNEINLDINKININTNKKWIKEFNNENVNEYLSSEMHYVLITPFLLNYNNINENYKNIKIIDNLWIGDINNFDYKKINFNDFIINWAKSFDNISNKITDLIIINNI